MTSSVQNGIFNRTLNLFKLIEGIRGTPSDEEVKGLISLLPDEPRENIGALLAPEVRVAGLACLRMLMKWLYAARDARAQGRKIILVPFNFPPELILAFEKAVPLTTEVLTTAAAVALSGGGERYWEQLMGLGLPDHICSANSIEVGSLVSELDLLPDAIVSAAPGACDANSKIHEFAAHYLGIPQLMLEKPVDDTPEGHRLYAIYYRQLIARLEEFIGEKLSEDRLRRLLSKANRCGELFWELFELHKARPCPVPNIYNLLLIPVRFCSWGTDEAIFALEEMVRSSTARLQTGARPASQERARVLWAYTSYYFNVAELHQWMEHRGYTFLADVLNLFFPRPYQLTGLDAMISSMAQATWDYPMNRQMAAPSMSQAWIRDMVHATRELRADCVIYCGHDACKQTWSVVSILKEELHRRLGVPMLILHGDSWRKTTTPIGVIQQEIDAFIQGVVAKKGGGRRRVRRQRPPREME